MEILSWILIVCGLLYIFEIPKKVRYLLNKIKVTEVKKKDD